ncbi:MAG: PAS domain S-box protein [Planctomycetes bacterium]|nr:PAS domain S-box protein [Planctomycetota bacterium]
MNIFKYFYCVIVLVLQISAYAQPMTEDKSKKPISQTIVVGVFDNYPLVFFDKGMKPKGIFPEILELVAVKNNWTIKYVHSSWGELLEMLETGEIDCLVDIAKTKEREKIFDYNTVSTVSNFGVVYSNKNQEIFNMLRLDRKRVAVLDKDVYYTGEYGIANLAKGFSIKCEFVTFKTYDSILKAVEEGSVDAGVVNRIYGMTNATKYNIKNTNIIFNETKLYYAFSKSKDFNNIINTLDKDLKQLLYNENSNFHLIHSKYLKPRKSFIERNSALINYTIFTLCIIIIGLIAFYIRLKIHLTRESQRKIKESEEKYRNLYETALVGLFRVELETGKIIAANESCMKILGYDSIDEFIIHFRTSEHYVKSDRRDEVLEMLFSTQMIELEEIEMMKKDGTKIWVSISEKLFEKEGYAEGTIIDITTRKKVEKNIAVKAQKLSILNKIITSANKFDNLDTILREILDSTLGLFKFDSGCINFVNEITKTTNLQCSHNYSKLILDNFEQFPLIDSKSVMVYLNNESKFLESTDNVLYQTMKNQGFTSGAIIPLKSKEKIIGTFVIANKEKYFFTQEEKDLINSIGIETSAIIQKIQIEEELRKQKENLQTMFDSIEDFIVIFDKNMNILEFNNSVCTRLGYEPDELFNMPLAEIHRPRHNQKSKTSFKDVISKTRKQQFPQSFGEGERNIVNYSFFTKFDAEIPVETKISYGDWGDKNVYFAISRDISERIKAEMDLKKSEQRNRALIESVPDMLFVIRKDGTCVDFRIRDLKELYIPPEKIIGSNIFQIMPEPVSRKSKQFLKKAFETKTVQKFEYQLEVQSGINEYEARFSVSSQTEVICIIRNISDRKIMENALESEKEQLALTLKSIGDGVITTDIEGKILLMNDASEKLTGFTQADAQHKKLSDVFRIFGHNTQQLLLDPSVELIKLVSTTQMSEQFIEPSNVLLESRQQSGESVKISISYNAMPIRDKKQNIHGIVIVFRDITLRKKLEEEILKATKLESLGILAGGLAHDFNNFLTSILGNSTLGKIYSSEDQTVFELFDEIKKASLRAKDLTYQLLTFSKGGSPVRKTASIPDILKESVNFALRGSNVLCKLSIYDNLWNIEIDVGQINQVFNNIIINADHAMPDGGILEISAENYYNDPILTPALYAEKYVIIKVRDEGIGISKENIQRIFDPYFTTKESGSGLGLATAYSIIHNHDGIIEVKSNVASSTGKSGTTFFIYLPASIKEIGNSEVTSEEAIGGEGTILVMDDEEIIRNLAQSLLTHLGYKTILAQDGKQAIEIYKNAVKNNETIDLLIMDLTVPGGMGGKEALQKIIQIDPNVKALVSSGYYADPVLAEFKKYGFKGVLEKPYDISELSKIVGDTIKGNHSD